MPADKYQIRLLSIAEEDFSENISYIAADNPNAADAIANKIEKTSNFYLTILISVEYQEKKK